MRYINLHFTYLLTYLLTRDDEMKQKSSETDESYSSESVGRVEPEMRAVVEVDVLLHLLPEPTLVSDTHTQTTNKIITSSSSSSSSSYSFIYGCQTQPYTQQ